MYGFRSTAMVLAPFRASIHARSRCKPHAAESGGPTRWEQAFRSAPTIHYRLASDLAGCVQHDDLRGLRQRSSGDINLRATDAANMRLPFEDGFGRREIGID